MKNYIGFVNDHSRSMESLVEAAIRDYNAMITAVKDAASREMLDTVVSTVGIGMRGYSVERQVVISNPHVLKPVSHWAANGFTPLYDGIGNIIELFQSLPDYESPDVSFLVSITTDGEKYSSKKYDALLIKKLICEMQKTGRWTFVFRVPKGSRRMVNNLGVPENNIHEWETTLDGMNEATKVAQQAIDTYFTSRSSGAKSSTTFYADANKVDTSALTDISKEVSLYVVPDADLAYLQPQAPAVKPTGKPTKSLIPKKMKTPVGDFVSGKPVKFFKSRRLAREFLGNNGNGVKDVYGNGWDILGNPQDHRWFVFL